MKPASPTKVNSTVDPRARDEEIRVRAYELFEARGREDGRDQEDWFLAEKEIAGRQDSSVAA